MVLSKADIEGPLQEPFGLFGKPVGDENQTDLSIRPDAETLPHQEPKVPLVGGRNGLPPGELAEKHKVHPRPE